MKRNNIIKILLVSFITLILLSIFSYTYAFFSLQIEGTGKDIVMSTGDLRLEYKDETKLKFENAVPGDTISKVITVKNIGTKNVSYSLYWGNLINTIDNYELHVTLDCKSYTNYGEETQTESGTCENIYRAVPISDTVTTGNIKGNISIDAFPVKGFNFNLDAWTLILFLRARNKDKDVVDLFTSGGPCKMLGENGCFYDEDERPSCGLMVKPTFVNGPCPKTFDDDEFMRSWLKHQSLLELFIKEYTGKEFFDYVYDLLIQKSNSIVSKIENNESLTPSEVTNYERFKQIVNSPFYTSSEVKEKNGFTI